MSLRKLTQALKGGKGSGNFGHAGRPGKRGGGAPGSGGSSGSSPTPGINNPGTSYSVRNADTIKRAGESYPEYKGKRGERQFLGELVGADTSSTKGVKYNKSGNVEFRRSYFYRHGNDPAKYADSAVKKLAAAGIEGAYIVNTADEWKEWPKDSYFMAEIAIPGVNMSNR